MSALGGPALSEGDSPLVFQPESFSSRVARAFGKLSQATETNSADWTPSDLIKSQNQRASRESKGSVTDTRAAKRARLGESDEEEGCGSAVEERWRMAETFMSTVAETPELEGSRMRLMVGMDDTLDAEDEEDEFDKFAEGGDKDGGSSDVETPLPSSLFDMKRRKHDRRANRKAAAARLAEDDRALEEATRQAEARRGGGSGVGEVAKPDDMLLELEELETGGPPTEGEGPSPIGEPFSEGAGSAVGEARVGSGSKAVAVSVEPMASAAVARSRTRTVPDHVKHPEKYTYYALEWSDEDDEKVNKAALAAARAVVGQRVAVQEKESPGEPQVQLAPQFVPRPKAPADGSKLDREAANKRKREVMSSSGLLSEEDAVEEAEDDSKLGGLKSTRGAKKYRKRQGDDGG